MRRQLERERKPSVTKSAIPTITHRLSSGGSTTASSSLMPPAAPVIGRRSHPHLSNIRTTSISSSTTTAPSTTSHHSNATNSSNASSLSLGTRNGTSGVSKATSQATSSASTANSTQARVTLQRPKTIRMPTLSKRNTATSESAVTATTITATLASLPRATPATVTTATAAPTSAPNRNHNIDNTNVPVRKSTTSRINFADQTTPAHTESPPKPPEAAPTSSVADDSNLPIQNASNNNREQSRSLSPTRSVVNSLNNLQASPNETHRTESINSSSNVSTATAITIVHSPNQSPASATHDGPASSFCHDTLQQKASPSSGNVNNISPISARPSTAAQKCVITNEANPAVNAIENKTVTSDGDNSASQLLNTSPIVKRPSPLITSSNNHGSPLHRRPNNISSSSSGSVSFNPPSDQHTDLEASYFSATSCLSSSTSSTTASCSSTNHAVSTNGHMFRMTPLRSRSNSAKSGLGASLTNLNDYSSDLLNSNQCYEHRYDHILNPIFRRHHLAPQQTAAPPVTPATPLTPATCSASASVTASASVSHQCSPNKSQTASIGGIQRSAYHSSSVSLLAPALEEKLNSEIRALQRELNLERERNAALNGQLAINSGLMAAFEQSLATLNSRLHQMACANERKAAECAKLQSRLSRCTCLASLSPMCAPREVDVARIDAASIMAEQTVGNSTGDNSAGDADSAMDGRSSSSNSSGSPPPVGQQGAASARAPADSGQKLTKSEELDELVRELNLTPTRRTPNDSNRSVSIRSEQDNGVDDETESTSGDGDTKSDESAQAIIAKLQQELREKDRLLIDTRLEALEAAGQIGQLEQAIADLTLNSSSHTETHSIFKPLEELQLSETDRRRPNGCHTSPLRHRTSSDYQRIV